MNELSGYKREARIKSGGSGEAEMTTYIYISVYLCIYISMYQDFHLQ